MKKIITFLYLPVLLYSFEPNYEMLCDEKQDSTACIKAAFKKRYSQSLHIDYLTKACDLKNSEGCYLLSKAYLDYKKNPQKSAKYLLNACELKHSYACYDIGMMAANLGREFQKDLYLDKACEFGMQEACKILGKQNEE